MNLLREAALIDLLNQVLPSRALPDDPAFKFVPFIFQKRTGADKMLETLIVIQNTAG